MFIWIGIDIDSQLQTIKSKASKIENIIGFKHSNFTLPLHISLKISFPVSNELLDSVIADIIDIFDEIEPFDIAVRGLELDGEICWIMMQKNQHLNDIHDKLNRVMLQKYSVPLHEYDCDYKFHTTLFMDNDKSKVARAHAMMEGVLPPAILRAEKFVIGTSESGDLGTYKVIYEHRNSGL